MCSNHNLVGAWFKPRFRFTKQGLGLDFKINNLSIVDKEEADRKVIGLNTMGKCMVVADLVVASLQTCLFAL